MYLEDRVRNAVRGTAYGVGAALLFVATLALGLAVFAGAVWIAISIAQAMGALPK